MRWIEFNTEKIKGKKLFRFLSEEKLDKFLETGGLWFSCADEFGDKLECVKLRDMVSRNMLNIRAIEARKRKHLICCFHEGNKESLAFWDTYARVDDERRKYAIVFDREYLRSVIEGQNLTNLTDYEVINLLHGKVKYKTMAGLNDEELRNKKISHVSFRKESSFAYEREYRFVIKLRTDFPHKGINLKLGQTQTLQFKILVNPLLESVEYKKCVEKIQKSEFVSHLYSSALIKWLQPIYWSIKL